MKCSNLLLIIFLFSLSVSSQVKTKLLWATDTVLKVPESVLFHHTKNMIFVSNINGKSNEVDKNGFISTLSPKGKVINLHWVDGLNAPKGMAISGNRLFVSDITELVEIDIDKRIIVGKYFAPESVFLNDVAIDAQGSVYVSDSRTNAIYKYANGKIDKWMVATALQGVNGLCVVGDTLYAGVSNSIVSIALSDMVIGIWANGTGGIDGLEWDGQSAFYFSDWKGKVSKITQNGSPMVVIDTTADKIGAADIGYNKNNKVIYVPTFGNNRVVAYQVK